MIGRILSLIVTILAVAVIVTLAVANSQPVRLSLNPFYPGDQVLALELPFFWYLLGLLMVGVLVGGLATWMSQGKWRTVARHRTQEALRWKAEAERLTRERDQTVAAARELSSASGPSRMPQPTGQPRSLLTVQR